MAIAARSRTRRAVNLDTPEGPIVPPSEVHARTYWRTNQVKNRAAADEKKSLTEAHKAFESEGRSRFELVEGNDTIVVEVATQNDKNEVSVEKLYALVTSGEITLPQFVSAVSATQGGITAALGKNVLAKVLIGVPQEPKFQITKKK